MFTGRGDAEDVAATNPQNMDNAGSAVSWTNSLGTTAARYGERVGAARLNIGAPPNGWGAITRISFRFRWYTGSTDGGNWMRCGWFFDGSPISQYNQTFSERTSYTYEGPYWWTIPHTSIDHSEVAKIFGDNTDAGVYLFPYWRDSTSTRTMYVSHVYARYEYDDTYVAGLDRDGVTGATTVDGVSGYAGIDGVNV